MKLAVIATALAMAWAQEGAAPEMTEEQAGVLLRQKLAEAVAPLNAKCPQTTVRCNIPPMKEGLPTENEKQKEMLLCVMQTQPPADNPECNDYLTALFGPPADPKAMEQQFVDGYTALCPVQAAACTTDTVDAKAFLACLKTQPIGDGPSEGTSQECYTKLSLLGKSKEELKARMEALKAKAAAKKQEAEKAEL